jgi:hypothetical protein
VRETAEIAARAGLRSLVPAELQTSAKLDRSRL